MARVPLGFVVRRVLPASVPLQQSEIMKLKYEEQGATVSLIVHPGGGHSSWPGVMNNYPSVWKWFDEHLTP